MRRITIVGIALLGGIGGYVLRGVVHDDPLSQTVGSEAGNGRHPSMKVPRGGDPGQDSRSAKELLELQRRIEMGLETRKPEADFRLIGSSGSVTPEALARAGIKDPDKIAFIEKLIGDAWAQMSQSLVKRARYDEGKSDPEKGIHVYQIPADREAGDRMLQELEISLADKIGTAETEVLMSGLHPRRYFGWFGKLDVTLEVSPVPDMPDRNALQVKYVALDPATSTRISSGALDKYHFENLFGSDFLPEMLPKDGLDK